jgi:hypothetical protein
VNSEDRVIDAIDELVDEQLVRGETGENAEVLQYPRPQFVMSPAGAAFAQVLLNALRDRHRRGNPLWIASIDDD